MKRPRMQALPSESPPPSPAHLFSTLNTSTSTTAPFSSSSSSSQLPLSSSMLLQCPICFECFHGEIFQLHLGEHFSEQPAKRRRTSAAATGQKQANTTKRAKEASSRSATLKCPLPDCTCLVSRDEWDDHFQLHEIETALVFRPPPQLPLCVRARRSPHHAQTQRQSGKERSDKRELTEMEPSQRCAEAESDGQTMMARGAYVKQYIRSLERSE